MKFSVITSIIFMTVLMACKKDHTCVCGEGVNGVSTTIHESASKAKKSCAAMEEEMKMACELE